MLNLPGTKCVFLFFFINIFSKCAQIPLFPPDRHGEVMYMDAMKKQLHACFQQKKTKQVCYNSAGSLLVHNKKNTMCYYSL